MVWTKVMSSIRGINRDTPKRLYIPKLYKSMMIVDREELAALVGKPYTKENAAKMIFGGCVDHKGTIEHVVIPSEKKIKEQGYSYKPSAIQLKG